MRKSKLTPSTIILIAVFLAITACGPTNVADTEPPLPTIVQVTSTPTAPPTEPPPTEPAPTDTPTPIPTELPVETGDSADSDAEAEAPGATPTEALLPTPTEEPLPTATSEPPPPTEPPAVAQGQPLASLNVGLAPVASGFEEPLYITDAGDGSGRLFVVEQPGRIKIIENNQSLAEPFLDIVPLVGSSGNEQGLLSVAFHPNYEANGYFFVNYTNTQGDTVIARYSVSDDPNRANPGTAKILLTIGQPYSNHNGGQLLFGPDGYLYIGMGDGGAAGDPENRAQDLGTLLGKILRLDVDNADPYGVPPTNPFVDTANARPEIWSYGWRNPWRIAFDPASGDMYVADVGQNLYEEVHIEPAGSPAGLNYGWRLMEGRHCYNPESCDPATLDVVLPVAEYSHGEGCSITGGYVYRGRQFPALSGTYFYGDYCRGTVWGLQPGPDGSWTNAVLLQSGAGLSSFGQDAAGEVYLVDQKGTIYQIINQP